MITTLSFIKDCSVENNIILIACNDQPGQLKNKQKLDIAKQTLHQAINYWKIIMNTYTCTNTGAAKGP